MAMLSVVGMTAQSVYENEVINNIMARRSVRQYLDKPVEHELLEVVVRAGINAPSGMNRQPWIVRVVEDQQLIADVNEVFMQENPDQVARDPNFKNMFRNAPNLICVCTPAKGGGELDAGLLGENMMLAGWRTRSANSSSSVSTSPRTTSSTTSSPSAIPPRSPMPSPATSPR